MVLPSQKEIEMPLLEVLNELGGQGKPKEIYDLVTKKFHTLREEDLLETLPSAHAQGNLGYHRQRKKKTSS